MNSKVNVTSETSGKNTKSIKQIEKKLAKVEKHNLLLEHENKDLKEKLLDLEY